MLDWLPSIASFLTHTLLTPARLPHPALLLAFSIVLVLAAVYYAGLIGFFAVGFRRVRRQHVPTRIDGKTPFVSVIVAARDEEDTIGACLRAILASDYPAYAFEVIVVDDFSEDDTAAVVRQIQHRRAPIAVGSAEAEPLADAPLRLLRMADHAVAASGHKRHALHHGIQAARGEIILTTDADCTAGPRWISTMTACFDEGVGFVAGPVRYRPGETLFGRLQALEFLALVATGAGGIGMGAPNMCNGANVAYRRAVYARFARRHAATPAGPADDEALAQHLAAEDPAAVRFCADPAALVETDPVLNVKAFWRQRRRWAGTGPRYPRPGLVAAILGVYGFYLLLFSALVGLVFVPALWPAVGVALALKIGAEATLLYPACAYFGQRWLFRYFLPEQLLQIPYVVGVGLAAALGGTHWKGRTVFR